MNNNNNNNNNFLRNDFNESMQNRNNAKVAFLQHEILQYQNLNRRLMDTLKLKKESLSNLITSRQTIVPNQQQQNQTGRDSKGETMKSLGAENKRLLEELQAISTARNNAQSKALIAQQVAEEVDNYQTDVMGEDEESLLELRRILQDKEYTVQEFEKKKAVFLSNGIGIKYRDVTAPLDQAEKAQAVLRSYQNASGIVKKYANWMGEQINRVEVDNEFTNFELMKLKRLLKNPVSVQRIQESAVDIPGPNKSAEQWLFPEQRSSAEILKLSQNLREKWCSLPKSVVSTVKDQKVSTKGVGGGGGNNVSSSSNTSIGVDDELQQRRNEFQREIVNERVLEEQMEQQQSYNSALMSRNDLILNSNQMHQVAIEKLQLNINFYQNFCRKYRQEYQQGQLNDVHTISQRDIHINDNGYAVGVRECQDNGSYGYLGGDDSFDIKQCKIFLKNMAEELQSAQLGKQIALSRKTIISVSQQRFNVTAATVSNGIPPRSGVSIKQVSYRRARSYSNTIDYQMNTHSNKYKVDKKRAIDNAMEKKEAKSAEDLEFSRILADDNGIDVQKELCRGYSRSDVGGDLNSKKGGGGGGYQGGTVRSVSLSTNVNSVYSDPLKKSNLVIKIPSLSMGLSENGNGGTPATKKRNNITSSSSAKKNNKNKKNVSVSKLKDQQQEQLQETFISNDDEGVFDDKYRDNHAQVIGYVV